MSVAAGSDRLGDVRASIEHDPVREVTAASAELGLLLQAIGLRECRAGVPCEALVESAHSTQPAARAVDNRRAAMSTSPHDALFRLAFCDPLHAEGELRAVLPAELVARMNFATLRRVPDTFVDLGLEERRTDVLYEVEVGGEPALVYVLLEHQSSSYRFMALRLLGYTVRIWEAQLAANPGLRRLTPIVPIVVAHDADGWRVPASLHELVNLDGVLGVLAPYVPQARYVIDDLTRADDAALEARPASALARVVLLALKHARDGVVAALDQYVPLLKEVDALPEQAKAVDAVLQYTMDVEDDIAATMRLAAKISEGAAVMGKTASERLREEGYAKGHDKGVEDGRRTLVVRMLELRFGALPSEALDRVDRATADELTRIADRIVTASTLEQVLGG